MFKATLTISLKVRGEVLAVAVPTNAFTPTDVAVAIEEAGKALLGGRRLIETTAERAFVDASTKLDRARRTLATDSSHAAQVAYVKRRHAFDEAALHLANVRGVISDEEANNVRRGRGQGGAA